MNASTEESHNMRPPHSSLKSGFLFCSLFLACLQASAAPTVLLAATPNPTAVGSDLTISVNATGFTDLYAWQLSVKFDPMLFRATGATEGSFLSSAGSTFFDSGAIDNDAGTVSFSFGTLLSAVPGATGSGLLESLTFRSLGAGTGSFLLTDVQFLDSSLNDLMPATTTPLSVLAVPELGVTPLLLAGLALLGLRRRRILSDRDDRGMGESS